jgi:hypothetical protein
MSLAMYAAPFDADSNNETTSTYSTAVKRRNINNRTQKRISQDDNSYNSSKVNSVLNAIHNSNTSSESNSLGDFKPIDPPVSVGVENTKINNPDSNLDEDIDLRDLNKTHMNEVAKDEYYKQFMPAVQQPHLPQQQQQHMYYPPMKENSNIMSKLNYMIHLLEEQKDERTNNVTEEVVLYSFLGIFVIFIVDSFVKVGKYVR